MKEFWGHFVLGTASRGQAFLSALAVVAAALLVVALVVRPLLKLLLSRELERDRDALRRRRVNLFVLSAAVFGVWVFFRSTVAPDARTAHLPHQLSELTLIAVVGTALLEVFLLLFGQFVPQLRGRTPVAPILLDLTRVAGVLAFFLMGVKQAFPTADIGTLVTTSAILSIVLGPALQESLSNVFGGIMLTIDRPYKADDWIEVDGKLGKVVEANWRSTQIVTLDDDVMFIPNSTMAKGNIINLTAPSPVHLMRAKIGIEENAPPNRVHAVLVRAMLTVPGVLTKPEPDVYVLDFGDSCVTYELRYCIDEHARRERIASDVMRAAWYQLRREGIQLSTLIREVRIKRGEDPPKPEETLALLRKVDILKPLSDPDLLLLAEDLSHETYAHGERICVQGQSGSCFYLIKSGLVSVVVKGDDGVETEVARLGPGAHFGEMSLLTGEPRSSTCTAVEDCDVFSIDRESFVVLLQRHPGLAQAMSEILAERAQATKERLAKERETLVMRKAPGAESGAARILERIRTIFRFKR